MSIVHNEVPRPCAHSGHAMMRRPRRCLSQNEMEQLVLTEPVLSEKGRGTEDEVRAARTYSTSYNSTSAAACVQNTVVATVGILV